MSELHGSMIHVSCDLCGSDDNHLLFHATDTNYGFPGTFALVRCCQCGLVYLNPRPTEATLLRYYPDEEYTCYETESTTPRLPSTHPFVQAIATLGMQPGLLCDIGCGTGTFMITAQRRGWQVFGIEPNTYARSVANARIHDLAVAASLDDARYRPCSFDAVTLWHTLEHVSSPTSTLHQAHRILKPNGLLSVAVPNFDSAERRIWQRHWIAVMAPTHLCHLNTDTLHRYMNKCGFAIVETTQYPGAVSLSANILRTVRRMVADPITARVAPPPRTMSAAATADQSRRDGVHIMRPQVLGEASKDTIRQFTARCVYPIAWALAKAHLGPEIVLHARAVPKHKSAP